VGSTGNYLGGIDEKVGYNVRMPVDVTIEKLPEATAVITLSGHMTLGTSLKVADSQINGAIAEGTTRMVIDLTGVDYMDSAGLGMLVYIYGTMREKNGTLRLCGVAQRLQSLLHLTKTDTFLPIDATREESLAALGTA
jgi:anti-sigma B factor antagonist